MAGKSMAPGPLPRLPPRPSLPRSVRTVWFLPVTRETRLPRGAVPLRFCQGRGSTARTACEHPEIAPGFGPGPGSKQRPGHRRVFYYRPFAFTGKRPMLRPASTGGGCNPIDFLPGKQQALIILCVIAFLYGSAEGCRRCGIAAGCSRLASRSRAQGEYQYQAERGPDNNLDKVNHCYPTLPLSSCYCRSAQEPGNIASTRLLSQAPQVAAPVCSFEPGQGCQGR